MGVKVMNIIFTMLGIVGVTFYTFLIAFTVSFPILIGIVAYALFVNGFPVLGFVLTVVTILLLKASFSFENLNRGL